MQQHFDATIAQAPNLHVRAMIEQNSRREMDQFYMLGARHAAQQRDTWAATTAKDAADSYDNKAALFLAHGDEQGMKQFLFNADQERRNYFETQGLAGDALEDAVTKGRGNALKYMIESKAKAGGPDGAPDPQGAAALYGQYKDQMDPASRLAVESTLKPALFDAHADANARLSLGQPAAPGFFGDAERAYGLPSGYLGSAIHIESGGDPNAQNGRYRGLGQFGPAEEARFGINDANRGDLVAQTRALAQEASENRAQLTTANAGRPPAGLRP